MYRPNLQSLDLPVPEIAIAVLGWGSKPRSCGRGGRRGSGMVQFERALASSALHSNFSSISEFFEYPELSQERVKLRTLNCVCIFIALIKAH